MDQLEKNRLVVIADDLTGRNRVIVGQERVMYELKRTVQARSGYHNVFDVLLPRYDRVTLEIGVPASLVIEIDSHRNLTREIDDYEIKILRRLFRVSSYAKEWAEAVVSAVSTAGRSNLQGSIDRKLRLVSIVPEVAERIKGALDQVQHRLPYLAIGSRCTINVSQSLDEALDEHQQLKVTALDKALSVELGHVFDTRHELEARKEYYEALSQNWPTINPPDEDEISKLRAIVQGKENELMHDLLLARGQDRGILAVVRSFRKRLP